MGLNRQKRGRIGAAFPPVQQAMTVPASVGGINTLDPMLGLPQVDCIYTYNLMPVERGLRLRQGYREWANNCGTGDVRTLVNYNSQQAGSVQDRLWAVTNEGIYNVTSYGDTSPTQDVTFSVNTDPAGYGVKCEFTATNADHYLFYADALNGIHQYKEGTGWSVPSGWTYDPTESGTPISFPVEDVVFVMVHKQRIWVILENSDDAWYLPVASVTGLLEKFVFGAKLPHGGDLMGLWSWTVDGGAGVDDMLVAISRGGDLAVYQGADPSLNDFASVGLWFIGEVPDSRRLVANYGSEMYILSGYGITSIRDLLQGAASQDIRRTPSGKINTLLRSAIVSAMGDNEWSMVIHPADGFMQIVAPTPASARPIQYNQNLSTKAWGMWRDVPMICAETWVGGYYMGGEGGKVWQYIGTTDGELISGTEGEPVEYSTLTSFQSQVEHPNFKLVGFIRAIANSTKTESFNTKAVWDYNEVPTINAPLESLETGGMVWDVSNWDEALWDYGAGARSYIHGNLGIGRVFAVAMKGFANARLEVFGWDVMFKQGGVL